MCLQILPLSSVYIYNCKIDLPDTLTSIYKDFATNALLKYLREYDKSTEPIMHLTSQEALPTDVQELYQAMHACWHTMVFKWTKWSFPRKSSKHTTLSLSCTRSNPLGRITAFKGFTESGINLKYQLFLHLSVRKFLAAEGHRVSHQKFEPSL